MLLDFLQFRARKPEPDIELGRGGGQARRPKPNLNGFPSASAFIASDKDHSASVYRAFHRLSARNLLYMEAELLDLEIQQDRMDAQDARENPTVLECFRSWKKLRSSTDPRSVQRAELRRNIRDCLKEYYEALVLQQNIFQMEKPQPKTIEAVKSWLDGTSGDEKRAPCFIEPGLSRLDDEDDLVALDPVNHNDWPSRLVDIPYLRLFCLDSHVDNTTALFSQKKINRAVEIISMMMAVILLIVSIVALYFARSEKLRLGLICVFTIVFAASVHLFTNAKRAELFACTAAYAAVLVVFVSGDLGSSDIGSVSATNPVT